jgi:hypothetical protein
MAYIEWDQDSIDAVDKLLRAFLWKNKDKILRGHCLVAWDIVTMPKKHGGLGIRDLRLHNRAVMANFTSKLLSSGIGPCFSWMASWHMQHNIPISPTRHDSQIWKSICKLIPTVQAKINPLEHHSGGTVGQTWENCIWLCLFFSLLP